MAIGILLAISIWLMIIIGFFCLVAVGLVFVHSFFNMGNEDGVIKASEVNKDGPIKTALLWVYTLWAVGTFILGLFGALIVEFLTIPWKGGEGDKILNRYINLWGRVWAFINGIRCKVIEEEPLDSKGRYMFTPNHTSYGDIIILAAALRHPFTALAMHEVLSIALLSRLFKRICVMVDRSDKDSRRKSVADMRMKTNKGVSAVIFPEGTFNDATKELTTHFHTGAFRIAIALQLAVVPIAIISARDLMTDNKLPLRPCSITAVFAKPIETRGMDMDDVPALRDRTQLVINKIVLEKDPIYENFLEDRQETLPAT